MILLRMNADYYDFYDCRDMQNGLELNDYFGGERTVSYLPAKSLESFSYTLPGFGSNPLTLHQIHL